MAASGHNTIRSVARHAGVAISTVSDVMRGTWPQKRISPATAERVRRAASALKYHPNAAAIALRQQRTRNIALVISDIYEFLGFPFSFWAMRLAYLERAISSRGYYTQVFRYNPSNADQVLAQIGSRCADGLIITAHEDDRLLRLCHRLRMPSVDIVGTLGRTPACVVESDVVAGRVEAIRHVARLGHRRIAVAYLRLPYFRDRIDAVFDRLAGEPDLAECRVDRIEVPDDAGVNRGVHLVDAWLAQPADRRPTVIFAHELLIHQLLAAMHERSLSCPRDVSLVALSSVCTPMMQLEMAAVDCRVEEVCQQAADLLIDAIESRRMLTPADSPPPLRCQVIPGRSCAALTN